MSAEARQWAYEQDVKPSSVKFVLVTLGDIAQTEDVWASVPALVQKTGQDRKTVMAALDKLEAAGLIADTGRRVGMTGQVKVYRLNFGRANSTVFPAKSTENGPVEVGETVPNFPETVPNFLDNSTVFPAKSTENGTRNPQEPKGNRKGTEEIQEPAYSAKKVLLEVGVDEQTIADWLQHRKAKRASSSLTVIADRKKQAALAGIALADALAMEVSRNWQGFEAAWLQPRGPQARASPLGGYESVKDRSRREAAEQLTGRRTHEQRHDIIDI